MADRLNMPENSMIPAWVDGALVPVEKLETHLRGLKHKAVSVFVIREGQVLIQKRAAGKYHTPGLWANTCCTHPHWGETAQDCAQRRLNEELGITGLVLEYKDTVEYRANVGNRMIEHEVVDIFLGQAPRTMSVAANPHEVDDIDWMSLDDLTEQVVKQPDRFTPWLRIYLSDYQKRIFGD